MRMTVFGAAGTAGIRIVDEALTRGHEVTAVGRTIEGLRSLPAAVTVRSGDAADPEQVAAAAADSELVVSATRPRPGHEYELAVVARSLLDGLHGTGIRVLVVGGAGDLIVPGTDGARVMEMPDFPPDWRPIARACQAQHDVFTTTATDVEWSYLSPSALLEPGARRGTYRLGGDELLTDDAGVSRISMEDLAIAVLDEAERPCHHRRRFTVGY